MSLTPETADPVITTELLRLLIIGAGFFIVGVIIALVIAKQAVIALIKNNTTAIVVLLVLSLITPLTINQALNPTSFNSKASTAVQIQGITQTHLDPTTVSVHFQTSEPALVYLEYTDADNINPSIISPADNVSQKTFDHQFVINNVSLRGGTITFVVNGQRYLLETKPYQILP